MKSKMFWSAAFLLSLMAGIFSATEKNVWKKVDDEANDYFPVQSDSERALGHPLVGVS